MPWQSTQVMGSVPAAVPRPSQVAQTAGRRTEISLRAPNTASENSRSRRTSASAPDLGTTATGAGPTHLAEERLEDVAQASLEPEATPGAGLPAEDTLGAEAVVAGPSLRVAQDLIGHGHLLELGLRLGVALVGVWMQLAGAGSVGPLDLVVAGVGPDAEQRVEVTQSVSDGHRAPR